MMSTRFRPLFPSRIHLEPPRAEATGGGSSRCWRNQQKGPAGGGQATVARWYRSHCGLVLSALSMPSAKVGNLPPKLRRWLDRYFRGVANTDRCLVPVWRAWRT